jgi:hypothetical protein
MNDTTMNETTTPQVPLVYAAICGVMGRLSKIGIGKNNRNSQQDYTFRGIDDVYNALSKILTEEKLSILPRTMSRTVTERVTQRGGTLFYVVLDVEFDLVCALDASRHTIRVPGEAMDSGDKATNKAMSAAYKYACMQTFCIPTEGDNDADATTHVVKSEAALIAERFADALTADELGSTEEEQQANKSSRVHEVHDAVKSSELYPEAWKLLDSKQRSAIKAYINMMKKAAA